MTTGEAAYNAYCDARHWQSVSGQKLPAFGSQTPELREAWEKAAEAAVQHFFVHDDRSPRR